MNLNLIIWNRWRLKRKLTRLDGVGDRIKLISCFLRMASLFLYLFIILSSSSFADLLLHLGLFSQLSSLPCLVLSGLWTRLRSLIWNAIYISKHCRHAACLCTYRLQCIPFLLHQLLSHPCGFVRHPLKRLARSPAVTGNASTPQLLGSLIWITYTLLEYTLYHGRSIMTRHIMVMMHVMALNPLCNVVPICTRTRQH